jgi:transposase-like protein
MAEAYLAGMNTRRVRRALARLFEGHVGKDVVSRAWQRTRSAWQAWQERDLAGDDIVRLILDGTVVKVRLDRKATAISLLIALGIRRDGQKVVLAIRNLGGESEAAWRAVLDDLASRGLARPDLVIVDGGKGLEAALASLWDDVPVQRCTVHKERNLLAHAPKHLHDEIKAEFNDMMHANTAAEVLARRKAFLARWKLRCRAVAESLEEACPAPRPPPCCSGRSWPRVRSLCAASMAGRASTDHPPTLTSPPDPPHDVGLDPAPCQFPPTPRHDPLLARVPLGPRPSLHRLRSGPVWIATPSP